LGFSQTTAGVAVSQSASEQISTIGAAGESALVSATMETLLRRICRLALIF